MSDSPNITPIPDPKIPTGSTVKVTVRPTIEPDLINFRVSNPVTYLRLWWKKIMSKEGIDFRFRIHPVTAVIVAAIIAAGSFGVGRSELFASVPVLKNILPTPSPTPNPFRDTAYAGILRKSGNNFYLQTGDGQAVNLIIPNNVNLNNLIGKRIFATGSFNVVTGYLTVIDATDLEVLPVSPVPVPTDTPAPTITPAPFVEQ